MACALNFSLDCNFPSGCTPLSEGEGLLRSVDRAGAIFGVVPVMGRSVDRCAKSPVLVGLAADGDLGATVSVEVATGGRALASALGLDRVARASGADAVATGFVLPSRSYVCGNISAPDAEGFGPLATWSDILLFSLGRITNGADEALRLDGDVAELVD